MTRSKHFQIRLLLNKTYLLIYFYLENFFEEPNKLVNMWRKERRIPAMWANYPNLTPLFQL
jgi:hypothetical protein